MKTYQPGEFVDPFNNSKLYTEMGFVVPVVGNIVESVETPVRPAPPTPIAQKASPKPEPKPEPAAPVEEVKELDTAPDAVYFTREDLESLYKRDLKELAKKYNIDSTQSKAELIDAIEAAQK